MEPIQTDEPIRSTDEAPVDFEGQLMAGCSLIGIVAFVIFGLLTWPWFAFRAGQDQLPPEFTMSGLMMILACGCIPTLIAGAFIVRKAEAAGAAGFLGGSMAFGVFLFLRMSQGFVAKEIADLPHAEYSETLGTTVPLVWAISVIVTTILFFPRKARQK